MVFSCLSCLTITSVSANSVIESAISWAVDIANDADGVSHLYSQSVRWGPSYDCSSLVISAFKHAGVDTGASWTGDMQSQFKKHGFEWIPWSQIGGVANLQRGDVLLYHNSATREGHTEIYLGNNQNVGAHSANRPAADQISVSGYYFHPWQGVLRYTQEPVKYPEGISAFGYDYPLDGQEIADKEFVFQGWVVTTKEISSITCSINDGQTYVNAGMYTRPDVPNATAFLATIPTSHLAVGNNKIAVCVNYKDGTGVVAGLRNVNRTRPTVQCGYDYPTDNQKILDPTFVFQGWVVSDKEIKTITCSLNDGQKYIEASLYKREDVPDATAFRKEISSNYLSFGENKVSVCVTYTDGTAETVGMRKVSKKYAYAVEYPKNNAEIEEDTFLFQGWLLTEKDVDKIQCVINEQIRFDANLYTREDVPDAIAFRRPIYSCVLTKLENKIALNVVYKDGTSKILDTRKIYNNRVILGHVEIIDEAVAPSCTETGLTQGKHCSVCDKVLVEQEVVSALGHTEVIDKGYSATYEKEGLTDGSHCSVCNKVLVEQETIPMLALIGDVNGDGDINILDATEIQRHIAQLTTIPEDRLSCADANKDGQVNILDATHIQRFIAQLIPEL